MITLGRVAAVGALVALAACGTNPSDRTQGGALAGAAAGAGTGALAGPVGAAVGAVVGGGAGAITGATTSPNQLNLGKPVYDNPNVRVPTPNGPVSPSS
jgi:phage tail tape-measure protein